MDKIRAKNDIVYFAKEVLGFKLNDTQKESLRNYEAGEVILCGKGVKGQEVKTIIKKHKILCREI